MKPILVVLLFSLVLFPQGVGAQEWSAEQMEVWKAVEACWDAEEIDELQACYHEDYVSWILADGVPRNKTDQYAHDVRWIERDESEWIYRKPLNIDVRGNLAIILYVADWEDRSKVTGEVTSGTTNWTEVFIKENGKWQCLTDHGTEVGEESG